MHALLIDQPYFGAGMSRNQRIGLIVAAAVAAAIAFVIASPAGWTRHKAADHRHHRDPERSNRTETATEPPPPRSPRSRRSDPRRRSGRACAETAPRNGDTVVIVVSAERAGRHPPARL